MNKAKAILIAAAYFTHYPLVDKFYITTDEQAFEKKGDAEAHAASLDKKEPTVFEVDRSDIPEAEASEENPELAAAQDAVIDAEDVVNKLTAKLGRVSKPETKQAVEAELVTAKEALTTAQKALAAIQA